MAAKGNAPSIPGTPGSGRRGGKGTVPNGKYPTVVGTRNVPANVPGNLGALTGGRGSSTVNSTPTK
jgi:hypothetical protein